MEYRDLVSSVEVGSYIFRSELVCIYVKSYGQLGDKTNLISKHLELYLFNLVQTYIKTTLIFKYLELCFFGSKLYLYIS